MKVELKANCLGSGEPTLSIVQMKLLTNLNAKISADGILPICW